MSEVPWLSERYEYDPDNNPVYEGLHKDYASENDRGWYIWKYTWQNGNMILRQGPKIGQWSNRANMGW